MKLIHKIRALFGKDGLDRELSDEMAFHLEKQIEQNVAAGMSAEEARFAALQKFGAVERAKDECRDTWGVRFIDALLQDVRFGLRMLAKNPGFTAVAVLTLALGLGAALTIFGFVDAALIKPLPYRNPTRLVAVTESIALFPRANLSYPDYLDWKRLNKVFSSFDVFSGTGYLLRTPHGIQPLLGTRVSDGFFRTLGVTPILGRDFYSGEDLPGAPRTVMLSFPAWQKWFGGRRDVVGQAVTLSGISYTIVGVLPRDFQFAPRGDADFWATLHAAGSCDLNRSCHTLDGIARLKDGVSVATALADMKSIATQLEKEYPDSNRGQGASVVPLAEGIVGDIRPILLVLMGAAGLLLLIACVNVTSLLLVRSESRKREIAVRGALGATSVRLVRQFAAEGLVLVGASGVLGLISARWTMQLATRLIPSYMLAGMPYLDDLGLNLRVVLFAGAIALVAALVFTVTPALRWSASGMRAGLVEGGRASAGTLWRHFGSNLVVLELAVAVVLLVGAGLLGKSFYRLLHVDLGFEANHLAVGYVVLPTVHYEKDREVVALGRQIVSRLESLPGVKSAAIASRMPLSGNGNTDWIRFVGKPYNGEHNEVNQRDVSSAYFATLRAKLLRGRYFEDAEDASKPSVVIINQALARKYFPGEDPIGRQMGDTSLSPKSIRQIIGVVDDVREGGLDSEIVPAEYLPFNQSPDTFFAVVVRTAQDEGSMLPTLVSVIHQIDPDIGTASEQTMTTRVNNSQTAYLHRSAAWLVGGFAALALLLGVVGLYGVVSYSVSQRTREIGVRIALGAERKSVYQLILKEAGWLTFLGVVLGLVCSVGAVMLMRTLLFGTQAWDAPTFAAVAIVLSMSALLASFVPARRAARVDPMVALRHE
jgi:macrolide transport system ATP-binding/permease protein